MADLVITVANVIAGTNSVQEQGIAGGTLTAGDAVYQDDTTGLWARADNNSATLNIRQAKGIALHAAVSGQPCRIHRSGSITIGATMTAGVAYYLSDTAGGICPVADLLAGEYVCLIGISTSTTVLHVMPYYSGVSL